MPPKTAPIGGARVLPHRGAHPRTEALPPNVTPRPLSSPSCPRSLLSPPDKRHQPAMKTMPRACRVRNQRERVHPPRQVALRPWASTSTYRNQAARQTDQADGRLRRPRLIGKLLRHQTTPSRDHSSPTSLLFNVHSPVLENTATLFPGMKTLRVSSSSLIVRSTSTHIPLSSRILISRSEIC